MKQQLIAQRTLSHKNESVTLSVFLTSENDPAAFKYELRVPGQPVIESTFYGEDTVQALLFCLTGAGDTLARRFPEFTWLGRGGSGILTSDSSIPGAFSASVHFHPID